VSSRRNDGQSSRADKFRFCGEDESNDPSEDFEEYLACASCGDNGEWDQTDNNMEFFLLTSRCSSPAMRQRWKFTPCR